jgi:hypothetical protein
MGFRTIPDVAKALEGLRVMVAIDRAAAGRRSRRYRREAEIPNLASGTRGKTSWTVGSTPKQ